MRIRLVSPPIEKQKGGVENAICGLRDALTSAGINVLDHGDANDENCVHHFHGLWEPSHAALSWKLRRKNLPYVVSPHGMLEPWAINNHYYRKLVYLNLIERTHLEKANALFVTSEMERKHAGYVISQNQIRVVPIGCSDPEGIDYIAARRKLGWKSESNVMLFLSRIDRKKGLHMLLDAMTDERLDWENWMFVIVGDGNQQYVQKLKAFAEANAAKLPKVLWLGSVWGRERWAYFQASDVFVLPTYSENFGIAVLEALYAGTPIITTSMTPWSSHEEIEGIFISEPEGDSLTECIADVLRWQQNSSVSELRPSLSSWAENTFGWDKLVNQYIQAYERANGSQREI